MIKNISLKLTVLSALFIISCNRGNSNDADNKTTNSNSNETVESNGSGNGNSNGSGNGNSNGNTNADSLPKYSYTILKVGAENRSNIVKCLYKSDSFDDCVKLDENLFNGMVEHPKELLVNKAKNKMYIVGWGYGKVTENSASLKGVITACDLNPANGDVTKCVTKNPLDKTINFSYKQSTAVVNILGASLHDNYLYLVNEGGDITKRCKLDEKGDLPNSCVLFSKINSEWYYQRNIALSENGKLYIALRNNIPQTCDIPKGIGEITESVQPFNCSSIVFNDLVSQNDQINAQGIVSYKNKVVVYTSNRNIVVYEMQEDNILGSKSSSNRKTIKASSKFNLSNGESDIRVIGNKLFFISGDWADIKTKVIACDADKLVDLKNTEALDTICSNYSFKDKYQYDLISNDDGNSRYAVSMDFY